MPEKASAKPEDAKPGPRLVKLVKASKNKNQRPQVKTIKLLGNQRISAGGLVKRAKPKQASTKK
jgi:RNA-binding protein